MSKKLIKRVG